MKKIYIVKPIRHMNGGWLSSRTVFEGVLEEVLKLKPSDFESDFKETLELDDNGLTERGELPSRLRISEDENPNNSIYSENVTRNTWEKIR